MTTKQQWMTYSIRIAPRKFAALRAKVPLTLEEWDELMAQLCRMKPDMMEVPDGEPVQR